MDNQSTPAGTQYQMSITALRLEYLYGAQSFGPVTYGSLAKAPSSTFQLQARKLVSRP